MTLILALAACTPEATSTTRANTPSPPTPTTGTTADTGTKGGPTLPTDVEIPPELDPLEVTVEGASTLEAMLIRAACPDGRFLVMLGPDGAILWTLDLGGSEVTAWESVLRTRGRGTSTPWTRHAGGCTTSSAG